MEQLAKYLVRSSQLKISTSTKGNNCPLIFCIKCQKNTDMILRVMMCLVKQEEYLFREGTWKHTSYTQMMQMQMMSFEEFVGEHKYLDTFQIVMKHLLVNSEKNELRDQVEPIFKTRETENCRLWTTMVWHVLLANILFLYQNEMSNYRLV